MVCLPPSTSYVTSPNSLLWSGESGALIWQFRLYGWWPNGWPHPNQMNLGQKRATKNLSILKYLKNEYIWACLIQSINKTWMLKVLILLHKTSSIFTFFFWDTRGSLASEKHTLVFCCNLIWTFPSQLWLKTKWSRRSANRLSECPLSQK